ncbi:MAG TPA: ATP synthase F1 subunit delta [Acidimicrobiia bacterium]|nr:ATP synthase F1 subunit delta [Acidimicrobiia bacterium]
MSERIDGYAAAAYALASAEGELDRVEQELFAIGQAIDSSPDLREALTDPRLSLDRKEAIVRDVIGAHASRVTVNLVSLFVAQGRGGDIGEIVSALAGQRAASVGKTVAEVRTAVPLDDATVARLAAALERRTGRSVEVRTIVDPSVLGGVVARVGDTVIDGSVARRLRSLRETLQTR